MRRRFGANVSVPAGTSRPAIRRLNALILSGLKGKEVPARLASAGVDPAPSAPEELVRDDIARYRHMIELTGAKPEGR